VEDKRPVENEIPETVTEERLPWHKPEVQQLTVSLDTHALPGGSGVNLDFAAGE